MTDTERDALFFKHHKGRYAPGGCWEGAMRPMGTGANTTMPQTSASRPRNGAAIEQSRELIPEPEALEADTMPYAPPRMQAIPGESENAPDEAQAVQDFPEMKPEAEAEPARAYFYKMDERSGIIR